MKKSGLFALMLAIILLLPAPARAEGSLSFGEDGTFTLLVLSDVETGPEVSPYYTAALTRLLEAEAPDLVILLGDQLFGEKGAFHRSDGKEQARAAISGLIAPLEEAGVPFVPVLGGQDLATGLTGETLLALYGESPLCLRTETGDAGVLSLTPWAGETPCLELVFFDESRPASKLGPVGVTKAQTEWFSQRFGAAEMPQEATPAVSFSHAPLPEIYEALTPAVEAGKHTVTGPDGRAYEKNSENILLGVMNEAPAVPRENTGLLAAFAEGGNVFLSVSGNNHTNAFLTAVEGIDLLSCPSVSYGAKSDRSLRGGFLLRFSEDNVEDYELRFVPFADYENLESGGWLVYALSTYFILSPGAKAGILIGLLALCIAAGVLLTGKKGEAAAEEPMEEEED